MAEVGQSFAGVDMSMGVVLMLHSIILFVLCLEQTCEGCTDDNNNCGCGSGGCGCGVTGTFGGNNGHDGANNGEDFLGIHFGKF